MDFPSLNSTNTRPGSSLCQHSETEKHVPAYPMAKILQLLSAKNRE